MRKSLTVIDVARLFKITPEQACKLCESGALPVHGQKGSWILWEDELRECLRINVLRMDREEDDEDQDDPSM